MTSKGFNAQFHVALVRKADVAVYPTMVTSTKFLEKTPSTERITELYT